MTPSKPTPKTKRPRISLTVRRLIDPATGQLVGALVPSSDVDAYLIREKRLRICERVMVEMRVPRNEKFHRMMHVLGRLMVEQVAGFDGLTAHGALKRLQRESGMCCDEQILEIPGLGEITVKIPQSMAFDQMDEAQAKELWHGICNHVCSRYWPDLDMGAIEEQAQLMPQGQEAA